MIKCPACGFDSPDDAGWCDFCKEPFRKKVSASIETEAAQNPNIADPGPAAPALPAQSNLAPARDAPASPTGVPPAPSGGGNHSPATPPPTAAPDPAQSKPPVMMDANEIAMLLAMNRAKNTAQGPNSMRLMLVGLLFLFILMGLLGIFYVMARRKVHHGPASQRPAISIPTNNALPTPAPPPTPAPSSPEQPPNASSPAPQPEQPNTPAPAPAPTYPPSAAD